VKGALLALALLALIEAAQRAGFLSIVVPAPSQVILAAVLRPGLVWDSVSATLATAAIGYGAALAITLVAAAFAVSVRLLDGPINNLGLVLHSIPVIAMTPLLALWIGTGPELRVVVAGLGCQFALLVGLVQGLRAADARQRELMHVLAASRLATLRYLLLPAALPYLFAGLKIAAPSAILGAITAEWAGADRGIGALMLNALFSFNPVLVWLSVVLTCALAAASYAVWAVVERRTLRWHVSFDPSFEPKP
jgi:NitT/TauT family transport system permease protein